MIGSVANYLKKNGWNKGGMILTDLTINSNEKLLERFSKMSYKPHTLYKDYQSKNITASEPIGVNEKLAVIKRIEGKTACTVSGTTISIRLQDTIEVDYML